jgi:hypothetical protein
MLESLWSARLRRAGRRLRPELSQNERLRHIGETIGREVESDRDLSWREANRVLRRLLDEVRSSRAVRAPDPGPATTSASAMPPAPRKRAAQRSRKMRRSPTAEKNPRHSKVESTERRKPQP